MSRTEHFGNLMRDEVIDVLPAVFQVLARVKMIGVLGHMETDAGCQCQTDIGVNIDFADSQGSRLAELVFRDTDGIRKIAAVFIDDFYIFGYDRGSSVQDNRKIGKPLGYFFEDVETKCRRYEDALFVAGTLFRRELICAMAGSDSDSQGIDTSTADEFFHFFRTGVGCFMSGYFDIVFNAGQLA